MPQTAGQQGRQSSPGGRTGGSRSVSLRFSEAALHSRCTCGHGAAAAARAARGQAALLQRSVLLTPRSVSWRPARAGIAGRRRCPSASSGTGCGSARGSQSGQAAALPMSSRSSSRSLAGTQICIRSHAAQHAGALDRAGRHGARPGAVRRAAKAGGACEGRGARGARPGLPRRTRATKCALGAGTAGRARRRPRHALSSRCLRRRVGAGAGP